MKQRRLIKLILPMAFFALSACEKGLNANQPIAIKSTESIVNGTQADMTSFEARSVVQIIDKAKHTLCTGTLIDTNIVLTAAHCALGFANDITINFEVSGNRPMYTRRSTGVLPHEKYNREELDGKFDMKKERADIALIRFAGTLPVGYLPIALPEKNDEWLDAQDYLAMGFGRTGMNKNSPGELRSKTLKVTAIRATDREFNIDQRESGGICPGDSGGPAMIYKNSIPTVVGVASAIFYPDKLTAEQEPCQFDALYTNVVYYRDWIEQSLKILKPKK